MISFFSHALPPSLPPSFFTRKDEQEELDTASSGNHTNTPPSLPPSLPPSFFNRNDEQEDDVIDVTDVVDTKAEEVVG